MERNRENRRISSWVIISRNVGSWWEGYLCLKRREHRQHQWPIMFRISSPSLKISRSRIFLRWFSWLILVLRKLILTSLISHLKWRDWLKRVMSWRESTEDSKKWIRYEWWLIQTHLVVIKEKDDQLTRLTKQRQSTNPTATRHEDLKNLLKVIDQLNE